MDPRHLEQIEAWIPAEMPGVHDLCRVYQVPREWWPDHPALQGFVDLALGRCVTELLVSLRARSETHALQLAAPRFGLKPDSVRRRWLRHRKRRNELRQGVPHRPLDRA